MTRYWMGVVSKEHVQKGILGGFAQVCHGKKGPLTKMNPGDYLVYYSPKESFTGTTPCKSFTAIGKVSTGQVYKFEMTPDFHPYRIDIEYFPCVDIPLLQIIDQLEFTKQKNWGMLLRRGILELSQSDFNVIAEVMEKQVRV